MKIKDLFDKYSKNLLLHLVVGSDGLKHKVLAGDVHRPGLALAGFFHNFSAAHILVFGQTEMDYLKTLDKKLQDERLDAILFKDTPAVIVSSGQKPDSELMKMCALKRIPLFNTALDTSELLSRLFFILSEEFAPRVTLHGTLVEVFGIGVMLQGESSVGKSEAALGLLEKGHRLISDDTVKVKKQLGKLMGSGPSALTRHMLEIRGIGIINAAHLHGAKAVRSNVEIDLVIRLEEWREDYFYDRVGLEEKFIDILKTQVPLHVLPVQTGRDINLLIETISLNHRLKTLGYHSAKEFNAKLAKAIRGKKSEACQKH